MAEKDVYEVGYGKPPKATRFQKGSSGNPSGRKTGSRNLATHLAEALAQPVKVRVGGKVQTMSRSRVLIESQMQKAQSGDTHAFKALATLERSIQGENAESPHDDRVLELSEQHKAALAYLAERRLQDSKDDSNES